MPKAKDSLVTIHTEGGLLPADLLGRISDNNIDGLKPADYHLYGERPNEAISRSWNTLQGAWAILRAQQEKLPESDLGTSLTRRRWLLPLFRELAYGQLQSATAHSIDGKSYPISHSWGLNVPIHLVSYNVGLDERVPGVAGAATASPHSLLQIFLNRSDDHLWGFVSNGYKLRILRDNVTLTRQAFVEFDLFAMMEGKVYSDFVLLWLLCHQSRVEGDRPHDCWLEKWMKDAEQVGTRALEQLRGGVEKAINELGTGFLEHHANGELRDKLQDGRLDKQNYYRQLLRIVYRLLFLFVAEDRDLLLSVTATDEQRDTYRQFYSTDRLRRMAAKYTGTRHSDLFEALRLVMRLLGGHGDGSALGITALGSFLFSDRAVADVINCRISNRQLLTAIRALSQTYDDQIKAFRNVDYKNLGPEELGSVYESLLELHPEINMTARTFALSTAGGNERKTTGSYYTPTSLINALLDSALDPVLDEAAKQGEEAILNLKVCDPACGSGHFLIAAANRMAKRLASIRSGELEPPPPAIQTAKRDIIGRCIYGVDINPMAAELCKVSLWMEALDPGKPLSFLDHHIQVGNSLLGTTPRLMAEGIPDDAFKPIEGDDKKHASELRKRNKTERKQRDAGLRQLGLEGAPAADYGYLSDSMQLLASAPDDSLDDVRQKEAFYADLAQDDEYIKARLLADAWCAAFVWAKRQDNDLPLTDLLYRHLERNPQAENLQTVRKKVVELTDRYGFFHWHVAFPDVFQVPDDLELTDRRVDTGGYNEGAGWNGGFVVILGNPPWERIKIQEKEWFAVRDPDIASTRKADERREKIADLKDSDPAMFAAFAADKRKAEGESHFIRMSGRFPLCGRGDVNTYTVFAETNRMLLEGGGRVGMICPSGIATDDTTKYFFQDLMRKRALVSFHHFDNRGNLFPEVGNMITFALMTMTARPYRTNTAFSFFSSEVSDISPEKTFTLSVSDINMLNPNTGTLAVFRRKQDAEISKSIYQLMPVLSNENVSDSSAWVIHIRRVFDMNKSSTLEVAIPHVDSMSTSTAFPIYEGKLIHQFNHRSKSYINERVRYVDSPELERPEFSITPKYWMPKSYVGMHILDYWKFDWLIAWRDICRSTDDRTVFCSFLPFSATDFTLRVGFPVSDIAQSITGLGSNLNTFILDYCARQMLGGAHLSDFIMKQLPVIPPHTYTLALLDFIVPRVLELTYTAWDLQPFARDLDYQGAPFVWDEARRFLMRCELDALYFHLYGIERDDVDYIMDTFPIVKRKDEAAHGEYRTKRVILEMFDQMADLPTMLAPAPKPEHGEIAVPDVSRWVTPLDPPPADPRAAHGAR